MEREREQGIGSVKAAISLHGQKFNGVDKDDFLTKSGELLKGKLNMDRLKETKKSAEKEKDQAEIELLKAKGTARELYFGVEKLTNAEARNRNKDEQKNSELVRELSAMKQKLSKLKFDMDTAVGSKLKAEKLIESSNSRVKSYTISAEELRGEVEELNEEHVLVELARIEAERECRELEAQRKDQAARFSKKIKANKEKISSKQKEIDEAKVLETKLAVTNSDLNVLQNEMEQVRAMERNFQKENLVKESEAESELRSAKNNLSSIEEEGFRYMSSMDVIRKELMLIVKETKQLKKQERKADSSIQQLNSRLMNAKSKLESASMAEERSRAIVSNLSEALHKLRAEIEKAKRDRENITEETTRTKQNIELSQEKILSTEKKVLTAMTELEGSKESEATALKELRVVAERTMRNRVFSFGQHSTITISKSEYEYLIKSAEVAQTVADKKVEAAQAWIEALKAEEKEMVSRTELVEKELKEIKISEETELCEIQPATPKRSMRENRMSIGSVRKTMMRRSSVSMGVARQSSRSPSFSIKRRAVMPNLVKFLRKGRNQK
ncbi:uncharacterized protein A4U43_C05F11600 [Asparagus officinalis]|uniref:Protein PLASTID MOVEMENT IMPAIRED 2 n=1 Tax=Asparagus officinalis TaxID=4686 RepID=A0A5P1ER00_ASPOF|nr:protein PLASTID MOVEMENT IMPAIRED 2 isoform X2 [Asparagus officinalis]ONK68445.1 uncharacterized protein A4U43_C05F11600 [Asparagus officinalis]